MSQRVISAITGVENPDLLVVQWIQGGAMRSNRAKKQRSRDMTQQREPDHSETTSRFLHLSSEELAQLSLQDLLQACLELRRLLEIIRDVLYTPNATLILRAVTIDLLFSEAERLSRQHGAGADAPVTCDI